MVDRIKNIDISIIHGFIFLAFLEFTLKFLLSTAQHTIANLEPFLSTLDKWNIDYRSKRERLFIDIRRSMVPSVPWQQKLKVILESRQWKDLLLHKHKNYQNMQTYWY